MSLPQALWIPSLAKLALAGRNGALAAMPRGVGDGPAVADASPERALADFAGGVLRGQDAELRMACPHGVIQFEC